MFNQIPLKIRCLRDVSRRTLSRAAGEVQTQLEHQAYLRHGKRPHDISVSVAPPTLHVQASDRVIEIAQKRGEPAEWRETVAGVLRAEVRKALR